MQLLRASLKMYVAAVLSGFISSTHGGMKHTLCQPLEFNMAKSFFKCHKNVNESHMQDLRNDLQLDEALLTMYGSGINMSVSVYAQTDQCFQVTIPVIFGILCNSVLILPYAFNEICYGKRYMYVVLTLAKSINIFFAVPLSQCYGCFSRK